MFRIIIIIVTVLIGNADNGRSQWEVIHPSVLDTSTHNIALNFVFFNRDSGIVPTEHGLAFTTDGGITWRVDSTSPPNYYTISFSSFGVGCIDYTGPYSFYITTDFGAHWRLDSNNSQALLDLSGTSPTSAVYFLDSLNGWEGYQNFSIFATTDGGITWNLRHQETDSVLDLSSFSVANIGFCNRALGIALVDDGADDIYVLRTIDSGKTWQNFSHDHYSFVTGDAPVGIAYTDPGHAWLCTRFSLLQSTDSGASWVSVSVPAFGEHFLSMSFADSNHGLIACEGPGTVALYTFDGGKTWHADTLDRYDISVASYPDTSVAYVASGYSLFRLSNSSSAVRVAMQMDSGPSIEVENNVLSVVGHVKFGDELKIFDVLGREALRATVQGNDVVKLGISSLPSGIYFVTNGNWRTKFVKE